jgi:hypothetical protein
MCCRVSCVVLRRKESAGRQKRQCRTRRRRVVRGVHARSGDAQARAAGASAQQRALLAALQSRTSGVLLRKALQQRRTRGAPRRDAP